MADQRQNMAPTALAAALLTVALLGGPAAHRASGDGPERRAKYEGVQHPRLLVTPEKVKAIREAIGRKGSHFQLAYVAMAARAEADPRTNYTNDARPAYWPVYASRELAFLSLIEKDPARRRHYAAMAAKALPDLGYVKHGGFKSTSLGHAMATFGVALTYDWAYNEWTDAERAKAEMLLEYFLAHWAKSKRLDPAKASGYNFYGVIYGAEATAPGRRSSWRS